MKKNTLVTWIIILLVIAFAIYVKTQPNGNAEVELAKCIGENSVLYSQTGCHACDVQEDVFGSSWKYINEFKCDSDAWQTCNQLMIQGTPTWIINGEHHRGVQSIEELKQATGC